MRLVGCWCSWALGKRSSVQLCASCTCLRPRAKGKQAQEKRTTSKSRALAEQQALERLPCGLVVRAAHCGQEEKEQQNERKCSTAVITMTVSQSRSKSKSTEPNWAAPLGRHTSADTRPHRRHRWPPLDAAQGAANGSAKRRAGRRLAPGWLVVVVCCLAALGKFSSQWSPISTKQCKASTSKSLRRHSEVTLRSWADLSLSRSCILCKKMQFSAKDAQTRRLRRLASCKICKEKRLEKLEILISNNFAK